MRKMIFLALLIPFTLIFNGCESSSTSANIDTEIDLNTVTAVDGYIKDANVTDSAGQVGVYTSSGQYTFANSIAYPITLTGGTFEDTNITFDITMTAQEGALIISPITTFLENNSTLLESFVNMDLGLVTLGDFSVDYIKTNNADLAKLSQLFYIALKDANLKSSFQTKLLNNSASDLDEFFALFEETIKEEISSIYIDNYLLFLAKVKNLTVSASDYETELMTLKAGLNVDFNPILNGATVYEVIISPYTGKAWLDRNLGAYTVCSSIDDIHCRGDYFQWGRDADEHEKFNSEINGTIPSDITGLHSDFIMSATDWTTYDLNGTQRKLNWERTDGSSICPVGFRVPTINELTAETINNGVSNNIDMFSNFLKFSSHGIRMGDNGELDDNRSYGAVWSSDVNDTNASYLYFSGDGVQVSYGYRSNGYNVRCIKD